MLNAAWIIAAALSLQGAPSAPASSSTSWTDDRPITQMAQNLKHDVAALPRPETFAIVAAGMGGALATHQADDKASDWARRSGDWSYTRLGGALGDVWMQGGLAVTGYAIGKVNHSAKTVHVSGDLIRAQVLNGVLTTGIKIAAGRTRPTGSSRSFPSGHTSATFASAAVLADHFGWKVGLPTYAVAGFVGYTRVRNNQHWLSDVAFGSALGILAGRTITAGHHHTAFTVMPTVTKHGAGLFVVRNFR